MYVFEYGADALKFISKLSADDKQIVKEAIELCLGTDLKKRTKRCNKKSLKGSKHKTYRFHISMKYTLFYRIDDENERVVIVDVMGINQAHSKYGLF